ncbi:MAG TPA: trehalose-phosphatase [Methylovirgula sp.]
MAETPFPVHLKTLPSAPEPQTDWALFLDLDGTLLDIAPTPDSVVVPEGLLEDLRVAANVLGGALAIVSGRGLEVIDRVLSPLKLTVSSEHGAVIRLPNGFFDEVELEVPEDWKRTLRDLAARRPGLLSESKRHNVVAHYRNAPEWEDEVRRTVTALVASDPENFELLEAKMAFEIRPRQVSKARAVHALLNVEPFRGRTPVFVGDDRTDHDGFAAAIACGGFALDVGIAFGGRPENVRQWLKRFAER